MAWDKQLTKEEKETKAIEAIVDGWIGITLAENKTAFYAWQDWRRQVFGHSIDSKSMTVPSLFPPETAAEVRSYLGAVREIRRISGLHAYKVPETARPWVA